MQSVTTLPLSLQPQTKGKGKQVGKQLKKEKHLNILPLWAKLVWECKECQGTKLHFHYWEFGILGCFATLENNLKMKPYTNKAFF